MQRDTINGNKQGPGLLGAATLAAVPKTARPSVRGLANYPLSLPAVGIAIRTWFTADMWVGLIPMCLSPTMLHV